MKTILYAFLLMAGTLRSQSLLHLHDGTIKNSNNQTLNLKGCNLGNWLMLEMWMLDYADSSISVSYTHLRAHET